MKYLNTLLCISALVLYTRETSCQRYLNTPKNGMLIMNNAKTIAVAFCPIGSLLVKDGKPHTFPLRFVYVDDRWITEPVDPSGGDLIPIPDCVPTDSGTSTTEISISVAEFFQYKGECESKEVQEEMKRRSMLIGACRNTSCGNSFIVTCG